MEINQPEVVAQVQAAFIEYERALVDNDVAAMNALFWHTPETVRYGIAEIQHGGEAIRAWRETLRAGAEVAQTASHCGDDFRHRLRHRQHGIHQRRDAFDRPSDADVGEAWSRRRLEDRRGARQPYRHAMKRR